MSRLTALRPPASRLADRIQPAPKVAEPFYQSSAWRAIAASVRRAHGGRCARCGSRNRPIVDHIVELRDGGAPLDPANLQLLCHACHQVKTGAARRARAMGQAGGG